MKQIKVLLIGLASSTLVASSAAALYLLCTRVPALSAAARVARRRHHATFSSTLFGHRGCRRQRQQPLENTLDAFLYAISPLSSSRPCDGIELDVRLTRDKRLVVHHDGHVNGKWLAELDYADTVKEFAAKHGVGVSLPLLQDVLDVVCIQKQKLVLIEVKELDDVEAACEMISNMIKKKNIEDRVMVISFSCKVVRWFALHHDAVATCMLASDVWYHTQVTMRQERFGFLLTRFLFVSKLVDVAFFAFATHIAPWWTRCFSVGPKYTKYDARMAQMRMMANNGADLSDCVMTYLWGFPLPHYELCTTAMRSTAGTFYSCDDDFEHYAPIQPDEMK
eukprot:PhM_4_TR15053/c0_g1_i1/m.50427/K01126/E3.1.4.46, glpQ, ugpQ; glycerophosphoryl diester phosphodiesterase